ncbi:hypothetical protein HN51_055228 [Arachis hypogaea]
MSSSHRYCSCYNTTPPPLVPPLFLHVDAQDRRCRFKQRPPLPWKAINYSVSIFLIILLIGERFAREEEKVARNQPNHKPPPRLLQHEISLSHPNRRNKVPSANATASQAAKRPSSFGGPAHDEKAENMIAHKEEIFSCPKRTWFVAETEKKVAAKAAKASINNDKSFGKVISAQEAEDLKMKKKRKREREVSR